MTPGTSRDRRSGGPGRRAVDWNPLPEGTGAGCRVIDLPQVADPRGNLTSIEGNVHVPFDIARVYYLYDVPGGESRGGHAHRRLEQVLIAVAGSFDVVVDNGTESARFHLNRSYFGLHIPQMTWREIGNFSSGSVCLVLASRPYEETDYYREFGDFMCDVQDEGAPRP
jgi:dTDP-4-dehydrorhamnose 3,5-epimerase-like enzyme